MIKDNPDNPVRRNQLMELTPSPDFLFGGEVKTACANMRDSLALNPLAGSFNPSQRGHVRGRGYHPYSRGGTFTRKLSKPKKVATEASRGRGAKRGASGARLNKFKDA